MHTPAPRRDKPFIWVTWLSGLLFGSKLCKWAVWHKTHFRFNKTPDQDMTEHNIRHTAIRDKLRANLESRECELFLEKDVEYKTPNVLIKGKIDALAVKDDYGMVFEVKSGRKRDSDRAQLMIYMWMLKRRYNRFKNIMLDGMLVYENAKIKVSSLEINDSFNENFVNLVRNLLKEEPPRKYPSYDECRWCNIADCDERSGEPDNEEVSDRLPEFGL